MNLRRVVLDVDKAVACITCMREPLPILNAMVKNHHLPPAPTDKTVATSDRRSDEMPAAP